MENKSVIANRLKSFREKLAGLNLEAALISKRENYLYMSGFTGTSAYLVITQDEAVLMTDFRYVEQASRQAPEYEVVQYQGSLPAALSQLLKSKGISRLGFEEAYVTYSNYREYKEKLDVKAIEPLKGIVEELRITKDEQEINILRRAVRIADEAFDHILSYIKPGVSESEVAAELEYFMKKQGARGPSFDTIVASGERAAMPHGVASEKILKMGDVITLDYGCIYGEYCSDMTRTVFLGKPNEEIKKIYDIVLEAQLKALEGARAGLTGKEIDAIARDIITDHGFEKNFGHGLGHGVGLEIHEEPRLSPSGNVIMRNGMTVTVEPGIYVNGLGGVRIEDIIIIKDDQPTILTKSSKELIVL